MKDEKESEMHAGERRSVTTWDRPESSGPMTGTDTARPREREAVEGNEGVVPGFTTTGPTGSQSGRSLYGLAPDEEPKE